MRKMIPALLSLLLVPIVLLPTVASAQTPNQTACIPIQLPKQSDVDGTSSIISSFVPEQYKGFINSTAESFKNFIGSQTICPPPVPTVNPILPANQPPHVKGDKIKPKISINVNEEPSGGQTINVQATGYTHTGNPTATGTMPKVGTIAVDPDVIPLGTRIYVPGYGYGVAEDTGGIVDGHIIDLFFETEQEAIQWGRRNVQIIILK